MGAQLRLFHFSFSIRMKNTFLYEEKLNLEGMIIMLEMIVFAVTLVIAQTVSGFIMTHVMMKKFMSKDFIKKYTKMGVEVAEEIAEEMEDYL